MVRPAVPWPRPRERLLVGSHHADQQPKEHLPLLQSQCAVEWLPQEAIERLTRERVTQFGVEGLSTSYLKRIGKRTSAIQNLEAMRMCTELRITNNANLIVGFPGATDSEILETAAAIERWALSFEPLTICQFFLGVDATIDKLRDEYGVHNVRNRDLFKVGLPHAVWQRLQLFDLDFDLETPNADWVVEDYRHSAFRQGRFDRLERDVYLYCTQAMFIDSDIMCREGDRYLSLAVATSPPLAARRIRMLAAAEPAGCAPSLDGHSCSIRPAPWRPGPASQPQAVSRPGASRSRHSTSRSRSSGFAKCSLKPLSRAR
jgi:hypothetical protein